MTITDLLKKLVEMNGSDLHLIAGLYPAIRVDGNLNVLDGYQKFTPQTVKELIYSALSEEQKNIFEKDA